MTTATRVASIAAIALLVSSSAMAAATGPATGPATTRTTGPAADLPAAPKVTLKFHETPITDALTQLFDQVGLPAGQTIHPGFVHQLKGVTVTADYVDQSFFTVLLDLCRRGELEPQFTQDPSRPISLPLRRSRIYTPIRPPLPRPPQPRGTTGPSTTAPATAPATPPAPPAPPVSRSSTRPSTAAAAVPNGPPVFVSKPDTNTPLRPSWVDAPMLDLGPLLLVADDATRTSRVDVGNNGAVVQDLRLNFSLVRDPRLRLFGAAEQIAIEEARDDTGRPLLFDAPAAPREGAAPRLPTSARPRTEPMLKFPVSVALRYPPQPTRKLALLRGRLNVTVVAKSQPTVIVDEKGIANAGEIEAGPLRFTLSPMQDDGDGCSIPIKITRPFSGTDGWDEIRCICRGDFFQATHPDATGAAYRVETQIHSVLNDRYEGVIRIRPAHRFQPNAAKAPRRPAKVVWEVPTDLADVSIPIEFKDLPLP